VILHSAQCNALHCTGTDNKVAYMYIRLTDCTHTRLPLPRAVQSNPVSHQSDSSQRPSDTRAALTRPGHPAQASCSCVAGPGCPGTAQRRILFRFTYLWTSAL